MPRCVVCLQDRNRLKFKTGRLSICAYCVTTLNKTHLSPRMAEQQWIEALRAGILRNQSDAHEWVDDWLSNAKDRILAEKLADADAVRKFLELKVLRAHKIGLVCLDRRYLDYPERWDFVRYRLKSRDKNTCGVCGKHQSDGGVFQVHHIIFRSKSGTNNMKNLVALCFKCHQKQHEHPISMRGGEPNGYDTDEQIIGDVIECQDRQPLDEFFERLTAAPVGVVDIENEQKAFFGGLLDCGTLTDESSITNFSQNKKPIAIERGYSFKRLVVACIFLFALFFYFMVRIDAW